MEKFKPEFGNPSHIDLIKQEIAKKELAEVYEKYGDYICSYDRFLKLQERISWITDFLDELYDEVKDLESIDRPSLNKLDRAIEELLKLETFDPYEEQK